jgi:endonuclease G
MAQLGMQVVKSGRRTGITRGRITDVEGTARINYGPVDRIIRRVFTIEPLQSLGEVSDSGDSGALWLGSATMRAVGLHFAGSNRPERALAMDLQPVLDALDVDLDVSRPSAAARPLARPRAVAGFSTPAAPQSVARPEEEPVLR